MCIRDRVQCLLSLIVATAHTGTTLSCNRIDLIDKNDTRCMFLAFFKKIADTGCTYTDKHFHEIRTGNGEEWNTCLSGYCFCKKCLARSGRAYNCLLYTS